MTEKEKMQSGSLYSADDRELIDERIKAKKLCAEYNTCAYNDFQKKDRILDRLVALKGENVEIEPYFSCSYGYNTILGTNFHADQGLIINDSAQVTFGDHIFIGPNCSFNTSSRPYDAEARRADLESSEQINIGSDVYFVGNVTVYGGVTIGDNVVITAGSIVTEDIPSNCIASGNPCRSVKALQPLASPAQPSAPAAPVAPAAPTAPAGKPADTYRPKRVELQRIDNPRRNDFPDYKK